MSRRPRFRFSRRPRPISPPKAGVAIRTEGRPSAKAGGLLHSPAIAESHSQRARVPYSRKENAHRANHPLHFATLLPSAPSSKSIFSQAPRERRFVLWTAKKTASTLER